MNSQAIKSNKKQEEFEIINYEIIYRYGFIVNYTWKWFKFLSKSIDNKEDFDFVWHLLFSYW